MKQATTAGERLAAKKRITRSAIVDFVHGAILEDVGRQVGIFQVEELAKGWAPKRSAPGTFKVWKVLVADSGNTISKLVTIDRAPDGRMEAASIR